MLHENIKTFRKERGLTQEELAIRVNVVRQTVSKWEKGLSVPDADLLQTISEVLEVSVSQLLGEDKEMERGRNEIAEQLSRINEQLAIQNRRSKRFCTAIAAACGAILVAMGTVAVLSMVPSGNVITYTSTEVSDDFQVLEDQNGNCLIITSDGNSAWEFSVEKVE